MSEAEVLQSAMIVKERTNGQNIDLQPFFLRNVLGARLRAENQGKIPILLYWHPNIDQCASTCKIQGIDSQSSRTSIIGRIKNAIGFGDLTPANELAAAKLLVTSTETLQFIAENQFKSLQKHVVQHIQRLFQSSWEKNWEERQKEIAEKLPKWDDHDKQMVIAFHIPSGEHSILLHSFSKCERLDTNYHGDDGLLRLFISFEFRRALRDKLIEQQRQINMLNDFHTRQLQIEQKKRAEQREKEIKEEEERQAALEKKLIKETVEEEEEKEENEEDVWQYDQEDTSTMLQKAGGIVVGGASMVVGGAVGGASALGGAALSGVNMAASGAGTLANLFRR